MAAQIEQLTFERDAAYRERDAWRVAAETALARAQDLRGLCDETRSDLVEAQRKATLERRGRLAAEHRANGALRRIERLQRAVARYRAEYAELSRQEREAVR